MTLVTHEWTVILVCLHTAEINVFNNQRSPKHMAVFLIDLGRGQGTAQRPFAVVSQVSRYGRCTGLKLVYFLGFPLTTFCSSFFISEYKDQSVICVLFLFAEQYLEVNTHCRLQSETKNGNSMLQVIYRLLLSKFNHRPL